MSMKPLAGKRVVDFGIITAGASTSAILSDLGADVIKVEGPSYIDPFRHWAGKSDKEDWWNDSPQFAFTNRGKRGFGVDVKDPRGREVLLSVIAKSDIVVENFRVGVMDRLGLGFEDLKAVNPGIVMASISSQGQDGPDAQSVSFGSTLEASSGMSSMIRSPSGQPLISGHALNYPDQTVSLLAAGIIMSAMIERETTGEAIHLDISQRELAAFMIGEWFSVDASPEAVKTARGDEKMLQCTDGRWVAYTLSADAEVPSEAEIAALGSNDAAEKLRAAGHRAEVALDARDIYETYEGQDGLTAFAVDPAGDPVKGLPWSAGAGGPEIKRLAPDLGVDNAFVAEEVAGLSADARATLETDGVLAKRPRNA